MTKLDITNITSILAEDLLSPQKRWMATLGFAQPQHYIYTIYTQPSESEVHSPYMIQELEQYKTTILRTNPPPNPSHYRYTGPSGQ